MGRVVINTVDESPVSTFPQLHGVSATGNVQSRAVIAESDRPLILWHHTLAPGSEIRWEMPIADHLAYVFEGEAEAGGKKLKQEGAFVIEHGGAGVLRAGASPVSILHFYRPETYETPAARAGGCNHTINKEEAAYYHHPDANGVVWVNSGCPTCELWFHANDYPAGKGTPRHYHSEDEIIVVTRGTLTLGRRNLTRGAALAVDANTVYGFGTGSDGMSFVNFRACEPWFGLATSDSKPFSERAAVLDLVARTAAGKSNAGAYTGADWAPAVPA